MLTLLTLTAALTMQEPPAPPPPPPPTRDVRVMMMGGPDGAGHMDRDGDGQVSREEFSAPMNDAFTRMDKDGDGRLSTEEMALAHGAMGDGDNVFLVRRPGGPEGGPGVHRFELRHGGPEGGPGERREERVVVIGGPGGEHDMPMVMMDGHGHEGPGGEHMEIHRLGDGHDDMDKDGDGRISAEEFVAPMREAFARMDADHSGFIDEGEHGGDHQVQVFTRIERSDAPPAEGDHP